MGWRVFARIVWACQTLGLLCALILLLGPGRELTPFFGWLSAILLTPVLIFHIGAWALRKYAEAQQRKAARAAWLMNNDPSWMKEMTKMPKFDRWPPDDSTIF